MPLPETTGATSPRFILDRRDAVPALIGRHEDFLIVAGLAGTSRDIAALTDNAAHAFILTGAMGGAAMIGLGLALARPDRRVLVATGDGELLMNVGALATIAVMNPPNLAILCVDNGHYGETGYQKSHTSLGTDLAAAAAACGWPATCTVDDGAGVVSLRSRLRQEALFAVIRISSAEVPRHLPPRDGARLASRFREALGVSD